MKFGLHYQVPCSAPQSPVQRYRDTLEQAAHAEALGFESVWPVEQHFIPDLSIMPAPMLLLAAVAERTKTLRLGIAIVLLPLSHPCASRKRSRRSTCSAMGASSSASAAVQFRAISSALGFRRRRAASASSKDSM